MSRMLCPEAGIPHPSQTSVPSKHSTFPIVYTYSHCILSPQSVASPISSSISLACLSCCLSSHSP